MRGWVYIITNESMPGLLKIGYTTKDPSLRAEELSGTGSPTKCKVEYDVLVENPMRHEQKIHKLLTGYNVGKEWFRISVDDAVTTVISVVSKDIIAEKYYQNSSMIKSKYAIMSCDICNYQHEVKLVIDSGKYKPPNNLRCKQCHSLNLTTVSTFDKFDGKQLPP